MDQPVIILPLIALLAAAAIEDIRHHRIPNQLVFAGAAIGVALNGWQSHGFVSGSLDAIEGWGLGFAFLLPLYLLRVMGAGDVKLMAMVGAFMGPDELLWVLLATFLSGGAMAIVVVLRDGTLGRLMSNMKSIMLGCVLQLGSGGIPVVEKVSCSVGDLPYAAAIAAGTVSYLLWRQFY